MGYNITYMDSSLIDMAVIKEYLSQYYESTWQKTAESIESHISTTILACYSITEKPKSAIKDADKTMCCA